VEGLCNETSLGLDYVWKRVSKGVLKVRNESRIKNTKKSIQEAHGFERRETKS